MTDAELIELVETRSPEDWSDEELALVRVRIRESAEVRQAVAEAIRLNQALAETFGQVQVSVEAILTTAQESPRRARPWWVWGLGTALVLLAGAVLFIVNRREPDRNVAERDAASSTATEAATEQGGQQSKPPAGNIETGSVDVASGAPEKSGAAPASPPATAPAKPDNTIAATKPGEPATSPAEKQPGTTGNPPAAGGAATAIAARVSPFPELAETAVVQAVGGIDLEPSGLAKADLERWLEGVPGEDHRFNETQRHETRVASFDGVVRLKPVWASDSVLRFAAFDDHGLEIGRAHV